jgi:hypothetical protein
LTVLIAVVLGLVVPLGGLLAIPLRCEYLWVLKLGHAALTALSAMLIPGVRVARAKNFGH